MNNNEYGDKNIAIVFNEASRKNVNQGELTTMMTRTEDKFNLKKKKKENF